MTRKQKLIDIFLQNPAKLRYPDIENILLSLGFEMISVRGSHRKFKHSLMVHNLIIPVHNNDCKKFYKRQVSKFVKAYIS